MSTNVRQEIEIDIDIDIELDLYRKTYRKFKNVYLNDEEYNELKNILGIYLEDMIERLSSYMEASGKKYINHKAIIITWYLKDKHNLKKKELFSDYEDGDSLI